MRHITNISITVALAAIALLLASGGALAIHPDSVRLEPGNTTGNPLRAPNPITVDRITHDQGNIATTLFNFGYFAGSEAQGIPSGEFPRNSGHHYLAEIYYWMGATLPSGDTVVANTADDFQAITDLQLGDNSNRILLSTDTTRYYLYDVTDTVGLGNGNPAFGWRVWNADSASWVRVSNYDPVNDTVFAGGPVSIQESHYRFNDAALGSSLMGLEMTHTVMQWNYCYNEDVLFVILEIANTSAVDYNDFAFGLYVDIDVGGLDGFGENGRLGDLVAYDTAEGLAWIYDEDGYDEGWTARTGLFGTKYIETPLDIGMTSFFTDDWALLPTSDEGRFDVINATAFLPSLPPTDQFYVQCTRGITLMADSTVRVVYALLAGEDEIDFRKNADVAQTLYDNLFVGPEPPEVPVLTARAGHNKVYLSWTDTSEASVDPMTGAQDFAGYKLYRSDNQGNTWGQPDYNTGNDCLVIDYTTVASFAVVDPGDPIAHTYVDSNLINGVEYWYCLAAFDSKDSVSGVDALQSGFGTPGLATNVVAVTPRNDPAGYYEAAATVQHIYMGVYQESQGNVLPIEFESSEIGDAIYQVVFEDDLSATFWHLVNTTSGDTVLANQTQQDGDPEFYEVAEGIRVFVQNGDRWPTGWGQTEFAGTDTTLAVELFLGPSIPEITGNPDYIWGDAPFRATYEIRYTGDTTYGPSDIDYWVPGPTYAVPLEIWNTATQQRVSLAVYDVNDDGLWTPDEPITIVDFAYDPAADLTAEAFPFLYAWMVQFDEVAWAPVAGDVLSVEGAPLNGPGDIFEFTTSGVNASVAGAELEGIRVVPDPYFVHYSSMVETNEGEAVLEFQNVPDRCTIRIYSLSGDLVRVLEHSSGTGVARWDLLTGSRQQVASGIYLYHVDSPYGEHMGRFAVVK